MKSSSSVLVTGGAGFIGSHLVEELCKDDASVIVLDDLSAGSWANLSSIRGRIETIEGDVRDVSLLDRLLCEKDPKYVFHLAANASVPKSVANPAEDFDVNCNGTIKLLDALRKTKSRARFVLASSGAVYGEPVDLPIKEASALAPISPYGVSKQAAENECRLYHKLYGVDVTIARIFNAYGPRMPRFVILDFLKKLSDNPDELEILGDGEQLRDFSFVKDTVAALILLAKEGESGECYNVASGKSLSVLQLAETILEIQGLAGRTRIMKTGKSWPGDAQRWEVDTSSLNSICDIPRTSLRKGLNSTIAWYKTSLLHLQEGD